MEDKKQDVNLLEELVKEANAYSGWFAILADELSKVLDDIQTSKKEEDTREMKCPYKIGDEYYYVYGDGCVRIESLDNFSMEISRWRYGNTFPTKEEAELEAKRRNLLTRFRAFRDECNGDWKVDWNDINQEKYIIKCEGTNLYVVVYWTMNEFNLFGYFKNGEDAKRAIELFGDEIKALFVECE